MRLSAGFCPDQLGSLHCSPDPLTASDGRKSEGRRETWKGEGKERDNGGEERKRGRENGWTKDWSPLYETRLGPWMEGAK